MLDDVVSRPEHFADGQRFLERYCRREAQPSPLFEAWADMCRRSYEHFDPVVANLVVTSSLNFVTAGVLEARSEFARIQPTPGGAGSSWPWYLRSLDGVAEVGGPFFFFLFFFVSPLSFGCCSAFFRLLVPCKVLRTICVLVTDESYCRHMSVTLSMLAIALRRSLGRTIKVSQRTSLTQ